MGKMEMIEGLRSGLGVIGNELPKWWKDVGNEQIAVPDEDRESVMYSGGAPYRKPTKLEGNPATMKTAVETVVPQDAVDLGLMAVAGPFGKAVRAGGAALAGAGYSGDAEAGAGGTAKKAGKFIAKALTPARKKELNVSMQSLDPALIAAKEGGYIPRRLTDLLRAGFEPDMAASVVKDQASFKYGVPPNVAEKSIADRARYRAEPATTPGPQASEDEWAEWGAKHGVENFRVNTPQSLGVSDLTSRREIMIPGGLEGRFSIPDMFWLKGNNFDPNALPLETRRAIQRKFMRTHQPDPDTPMDDVGIFNTLNFSQLSPNQPLTQNEFIAMRSRIRNEDELRELAARAGEKGLDTKRGVELGVQAAGKGGMGVRGTPSLAAPAELAKQLIEKPEMFRAGEGETIRDVVSRVTNQTPSLSQKTGGLGVPMTDLARGNSAAVDLHMIRNMLPDLLAEPDIGPRFLADANRLLGKKFSADELAEVIRHEIDNPKLPQSTFKKIRGLIESTDSNVYREKKTGELSEAAKSNPAIHPDKLLYEPAKAQRNGEYYQAMLNLVDRGRGAEPDLPLFPEQWMRWDGYRNRLEPHEFLHPDYRKLPKQSFSEMADAFKAHKDAGYTYQNKTGLPSVMKQKDWRELYFGKADPTLLGAMGAGSAGAAALPVILSRMRGE